MKYILALFVVALILGIFFGCKEKVNQVDFALRDGFQGIIHVELDTTNGVAVDHINGRYEFAIPANGEVKVTDLSSLAEYIQITPRYENGLCIPFETSTNATNTVLYVLNGPQGDGYYFFVGSYVDWKVVYTYMAFYKLPCGVKFNIQDGKIFK